MSKKDSGPDHDEEIRKQFAQRIKTYEKSAAWMLSPDLIKLQRETAGQAPNGHDKCLDLCCGTGIVGRNLLDLGWKVTGVDLTPEMGFVASEYFPVKIGSIEKIEVEDESYDLATLRQSFMLVDRDKALREIYRVLKPGGRFILYQSTAFSDDDEETYSQVQWARHINQTEYYRTEDLKNMLLKHGFDVTDSRTIRVRESVDHWLNSAPELLPDLRKTIRALIAEAPAAYKKIRNVEIADGVLYEDWNWLAVTGTKK